MDIISVKGLVKCFGDKQALQGLDLTVQPGELLGLVGPNGAGKTTTVKILTGVLQPTAGEISILGLDLASHGPEIKRQTGSLLQDPSLYDYLTGEEQLFFTGSMYGLAPELIRRRSEELLETFQLVEARRQFIWSYSHGMKRKLALACALIHAPRLLYLDEPFEGLDTLSQRRVRKLLLKFVAQGGTVLLTSHTLEIVENICTDVAIIVEGRVVLQDRMSSIRTRVRWIPGEERTSKLEKLLIELLPYDEEKDESISWLQSGAN
jgi:ABC-2 type transport system ATP-binding protein